MQEMVMNRFFGIVYMVTLFGLSETVYSQTPANELMLRVDPRVELLCIAFRLAEYPEVIDTLNSAYTQRIDAHFQKHKNHPLIEDIRLLLDSVKKHDIEFGYWDIPAIAIHIRAFADWTSVAKADPPVDDIWDNRTWLTPRRMELIRAFYYDSDARRFFDDERDYYARAEASVNHRTMHLQKTWLQKYFGMAESEAYFAILGLQLRQGAYLRVNTPHEMRQTFTLFPCTAFDHWGLPVSLDSLQIIRSILHEYIHAFVNQAVDAYESQWQKPAELILADPHVWSLMKDAFYNNPRYLVYESLVRATSIIYLTRHHPELISLEKEITTQEKWGFYWMGEMVRLLEDYDKERNRYSDFYSIMPEVCRLLESVSGRMRDGKYVFPNHQ